MGHTFTTNEWNLIINNMEQIIKKTLPIQLKLNSTLLKKIRSKRLSSIPNSPKHIEPQQDDLLKKKKKKKK